MLGFGATSQAELLWRETVIDQKMRSRQVEPDSELHFVIDNDDGTEALVFAVGFRVLVQLP